MEFPRRTRIVEGGFRPDTRYEKKLQEMEAQHTALDQAVKDYGHNVIILPIILGQSGSQHPITFHTLAKIEHEPARKVMTRLYQHFVLTVHNILTSRKVLEREKTDKSRQNRPNPPWV